MNITTWVRNWRRTQRYICTNVVFLSKILCIFFKKTPSQLCVKWIVQNILSELLLVFCYTYLWWTAWKKFMCHLETMRLCWRRVLWYVFDCVCMCVLMCMFSHVCVFQKWISYTSFIIDTLLFQKFFKVSLKYKQTFPAWKTVILACLPRCFRFTGALINGWKTYFPNCKFPPALVVILSFWNEFFAQEI